MKYIEIVLVMMCLNLSFTLVQGLNLIPMADGFDESYRLAGMNNFSDLTFDYKINQSDNNINSQIMEGLDGATYSKSLLQTTVFQDTDFLTGTWILIEILGDGLFYVSSTLNSFGVPPEMHFIFVVPIYFMYLLALFQVISGRSVEGNK